MSNPVGELLVPGFASNFEEGRISNSKCLMVLKKKCAKAWQR